MFFFAKIVIVPFNLGYFQETVHKTIIWAMVKSIKTVFETASFQKSYRPAVTTLYLLRSPVETIENSCGDNHCVKSVQIRSFSWTVFSCIWIEYGDLWSKSRYSVRIQKIMDQKKLRIWTIFMQWTLEYSPNLIQFYRRFSTRGTEQCSFVEVSRFWLQGNIRKCSRLSRNGLAATVF